VLHDIATAVRAGKPIDLAVNALNFIWQGDANNRALLCLDHAQIPANTLNITGAEIFSVRAIAERLARLLGVKATFVNEHAHVPTYISNAARSIQLFGPPRVPPDRLIEWQADWVSRGGASLGKPTHFQVKDGQFLDSTRIDP
jgi:nucleoside-diphosphate-sugar epimerase